MIRFSINCITFKRPQLLEEAIHSVLQQTFQNFELIIVNDCPEQTLVFEHPKIRIWNTPRFPTLGDKRNFAMAQSTGQYLLLLDDDDLLLPQYLENLDTLLTQHKNPGLLSGQRVIMCHSGGIDISPAGLTSMAVFRRDAIPGLRYPSMNFDEVTPFFNRLRGEVLGPRVFKLLPIEQTGYVYRRVLPVKTYSMSLPPKDSTPEVQASILDRLAAQAGTIQLRPHWDEDYSTIMSRAKLPEKPVITPAPPPPARVNVRESWARAMSFVRAIESRGVLATAAQVVGLNNTKGERVDEATFQRRHLSCFGNTNVPPCDNLRSGKTFHYCATCGCGESELARLDGPHGHYTKLHFPELDCPLARPGFSNHKP